MTVVIQIGNSDDKLPQRKWAEFCSAVNLVISRYVQAVHFNGHSHPGAIWQNACWIIEPLGNLDELRDELSLVADTFDQDSIAMTVGQTEFIQR